MLPWHCLRSFRIDLDLEEERVQRGTNWSHTNETLIISIYLVVRIEEQSGEMYEILVNRSRKAGYFLY